MDYKYWAKGIKKLIENREYDEARQEIAEAKRTYEEERRKTEQEMRGYEESDRGTMGMAMGFFCRTARFEKIRELEDKLNQLTTKTIVQRQRIK